VNTLNVGDVVGVSPVRYSDNTCKYCTNKEKTTNMCDERVYTYDGAYFGGFATHMQIDNHWAFKVPQGLLPHIKDLPPLLCAGVTVYAPLRRYCKPGAKCAIIGIGGLGHLGVMFGNKLGMKVTAFTTKVNTPEPYLAMGASDVQHSVNEEELAKLEGTFDLVISTLYIKKPALHRLHQRLTKTGGVFVMVGAPDTNSPYILDNEYLVNNEITVAGSNVGSQ
jgi:D-arabinose 1-dehydrogenase-like Zn-dependent alcohol dehydrogenase